MKKIKLVLSFSGALIAMTKKTLTEEDFMSGNVYMAFFGERSTCMAEHITQAEAVGLCKDMGWATTGHTLAFATHTVQLLRLEIEALEAKGKVLWLHNPEAGDPENLKALDMFEALLRKAGFNTIIPDSAKDTDRAEYRRKFARFISEGSTGANVVAEIVLKMNIVHGQGEQTFGLETILRPETTRR